MEQKSVTQEGQWESAVPDYLRQVFHNSIYVRREHKLFFLISRNENEMIDQRELDTWNASLKADSLRGGLTGPFTDFSNMSRHCSELDLAIAVGQSNKENKGESIVWFQQHLLDAMLVCLHERGILESFCYPPVLKLADYDRWHRQHLVETLRAYIRSPKDIPVVCESLGVHKNTLYKRLEKIKDVMGCDISAADNVLQIQLTLKILDAVN